MTPFRELDPLLHSQLRLAIMSILISVDSADFIYLREKTDATAGNLSVQIGKLKEAGYISVKKVSEKVTRRRCAGSLTWDARGLPNMWQR